MVLTLFPHSMIKKKILFIINPISGAVKKAGIPDLVTEFIDEERFESEIYFSNYRGDAGREALEAMERKMDAVIAVGGDGTINEIASSLTGSDTALGIIPLGSGNGLARHLGIPINSRLAVQQLNRNKLTLIDTAYVNEHPFFNVAGIGFDAYVGYLFANIPGRGFKSYAKATWKALMTFKPFKVKIQSDNASYDGEVFLLSFANSTQFGNNCYINPDGIIHDGKIEIVLLRPFPALVTPIILWRLFARKIKGSKYVETFSVNAAVIETESPMHVQVDGDVLGKMQKVTLRVEQEALRVFI